MEGGFTEKIYNQQRNCDILIFLLLENGKNVINSEACVDVACDTRSSIEPLLFSPCLIIHGYRCSWEQWWHGKAFCNALVF